MSRDYPDPKLEFVEVEDRCLCGDVTYRASGESFGIIHCFCQRCRKHSGASATAFMILFVGSQAEWHRIHDELLQWEETGIASLNRFMSMIIWVPIFIDMGRHENHD